MSILVFLGLKDEGYEADWNFQYLCRACNVKKGANADYTNPKTLELLVKFVKLAVETYEDYGKERNG